MTTPGAPKIFGIGLSKTGTAAWRRRCRSRRQDLDNMGASRYVAATCRRSTWRRSRRTMRSPTRPSSFYRELDRRYPGSKFISRAGSEGWLKSCMKQFSLRFAESQSEPNKRLFVDCTHQRVRRREVRARLRPLRGRGHEYFRDRTDDLLVLNVTAGEGWERLCRSSPSRYPTPFPRRRHPDSLDEDGGSVAVAEEAGRALLQRYQGQVATAAVSPGGGSRVAGRRLLDRAMQVALGLDATEAALRSSHRSLVSA